MTVAELIEVLRVWPHAHQGGATVAIVAGAYVLQLFNKWAIAQLVTRPEIRQGYWALSRNLLVFVATALIVAVWIEELKAVSLLLTGLLAATLLVNKELFLGFASRITLSVIKQYDIGDRIRINNVCGDVIDIGLLATWLMEVDTDGGVENQSTGRVVIIPHIWLSQYAVVNLTRGHDFLWDELTFNFPPDVDAARISALLTTEAERHLGEEIAQARRAVRKMAEDFASHNPPVTPITYARMSRLNNGHQYLMLTVRFCVQVRRRRSVHSRLLVELLRMLREEKIPFYMGLYETLPTEHKGPPLAPVPMPGQTPR